MPKLAITSSAQSVVGAKVEAVPPVSAAHPGWRLLPSYPRELGVAGILAGQHDGVLIAAGGANFSDGPFREGGKKVTHDDIHILLPGETAWRPAGRLHEPRGYAAVVSVPGGLLVVGGENADKIFSDALLLRWDGMEVVIETAPGLPAPISHQVAGQLSRLVLSARFSLVSP